jgi:thiamine biosynthesis lipoprotein
LIKRRATITLDLASVAKGYAVDALAQLIRERDYTNFLVEIGGEVYAAGHRIDGTPWRIGINQPEAAAPANQVYQMVRLENRAFATSGDYRNFFEFEGRRYAHIIDPRTGYPAARHLVSVSVLAENCALADGLATALMVMGPQAGLELINRLEGVTCLMVERSPDGRLVDHRSNGFPPQDNASP